MFIPALLLWLVPAASGLDAVVQTLARGEYRSAHEQLATIQERNARWYLLSSKAWDGLNDPAKAVAEAEQALKLEPGNPVYHVHLAQIFLARNTPKAAAEIFDEALALFPDMYVLRLGKGLALKELQLYQEAESEFLWCLAQRPESPIAFDALGTIYLHFSKFDEAAKIATDFVQRNPGDYRGYYYLAAARDGQTLPAGEIRKLLADSLQRNPKFGMAHALMGKVLLREEKTAEAVDYLRKAIEFRPDLVQAHLHLARALRLLGDQAGSAREFEAVRKLKAKEQEPRPSLRYHRGSR